MLFASILVYHHRCHLPKEKLQCLEGEAVGIDKTAIVGLTLWFESDRASITTELRKVSTQLTTEYIDHKTIFTNFRFQGETELVGVEQCPTGNMM